MLTSTMVKSVCTLAGVVVLATGCAQSMAGPMSSGDKSTVAASTTPAASLRVAAVVERSDARIAVKLKTRWSFTAHLTGT